jgi:hypothetical protein
MDFLGVWYWRAALEVADQILFWFVQLIYLNFNSNIVSFSPHTTSHYMKEKPMSKRNERNWT